MAKNKAPIEDIFDGKYNCIYTPSGRVYIALLRALMLDTRRRFWRDLTGADVDVNALISRTDDVREKFENGGFNNAKK